MTGKYKEIVNVMTMMEHMTQMAGNML